MLACSESFVGRRLILCPRGKPNRIDRSFDGLERGWQKRLVAPAAHPMPGHGAAGKSWLLQAAVCSTASRNLQQGARLRGEEQEP